MAKLEQILQSVQKAVKNGVIYVSMAAMPFGLFACGGETPQPGLDAGAAADTYVPKQDSGNTGNDAGMPKEDVGGQTDVKAVLKYFVNDCPIDISKYQHEPKDVTIKVGDFICYYFCDSIGMDQATKFKLTDTNQLGVGFTGQSGSMIIDKSLCNGLSANYDKVGDSSIILELVDSNQAPIGKSDSFGLQVN